MRGRGCCRAGACSGQGPSQRGAGRARQQADALPQGRDGGHDVIRRLRDAPPLCRPAPEAALRGAGACC